MIVKDESLFTAIDALNPGPEEAFLWWGEGGGLSRNVGHHGWWTAKN